jgi:hypothetical protein
MCGQRQKMRRWLLRLTWGGVTAHFIMKSLLPSGMEWTLVVVNRQAKSARDHPGYGKLIRTGFTYVSLDVLACVMAGRLMGGSLRDLSRKLGIANRCLVDIMPLKSFQRRQQKKFKGKCGRALDCAHCAYLLDKGFFE